MRVKKGESGGSGGRGGRVGCGTRSHAVAPKKNDKSIQRRLKHGDEVATGCLPNPMAQLAGGLPNPTPGVRGLR